MQPFRFGMTLLASTLALTLLSGCDSQADAPQNQMNAPAPVVSVAPALHQSVYDWNEFTGRLEAPETVELKPRISGVVDKVLFDEGAFVQAGAPLFQIDPRPFQAEVDRLAAEVASARSQLGLAERDLQRAVSLKAGNAVSAETLDNRQAQRDQAAARLKALQATLQLAQLNLDYTHVNAPISGRVSRALVTEGNYVSAGQTLLTSLVFTDKVYAYFDADEQTYLKYRQHHAEGAAVPVFLQLANESGFPHQGRIDFVDNRLNPQTGTIRARAVFDNPDGQFTPGLFARLKLAVSGQYDAVLISDRAVGTDLSNQFVLVVDGANQVAYRPVTLGARLHGLRVVKNGLKDGETIVVNGLQRVRPGIEVQPETVPMTSADTLARLALEQDKMLQAAAAPASQTPALLKTQLKEQLKAPALSLSNSGASPRG